MPAWLRDACTGLMRVASEAMRLHEAAVPPALRALDAAGTNRIVDLCSGAGGPAIALTRRLTRRGDRFVELLLTDKFPNIGAFELAERQLPGIVKARRTSLDAACVDGTLTGLRTLFNGLHHLPPETARSVFADAAAKRQPILALEVVERSFAGFLGVALTPLGVLAMTPFVRPVRLRSLALTYLLPLIPTMLTWDGFASCLRAYSLPELEDLVRELRRPDYDFRVERRRVPWTAAHVTTVLGFPC